MRSHLLAILLLAAMTIPLTAGHPCRSGNCDAPTTGYSNCGRATETYHNRQARLRAARGPWHGNYYHTMWGQPVALMVPPTAEYQVDYSWGVASTRIRTIDHQFSRAYPGPYGGPNGGPYGFRGTPPWPSDTRQFGVYYVRSPW